MGSYQNPSPSAFEVTRNVYSNDRGELSNVITIIPHMAEMTDNKQ